MTAGTVAALHIHPVKSCRRIELQEATVAAHGLVGDREWQVVDADGACLTQRQERRMALIAPEPIAGGLRLSAPGHDPLEVARPTEEDRTVRALLGDEVPVGDAGDAAARWLSAVLDRECRLVALTRPDARHVKLVPQQPVSFADAAPVLVANLASLAFLQARAAEPFGMERFRPNIVVDSDTPWAEDTWKTFSVGAAELEALLPWPRCAVPQIDQDSAERGKEPAVVLKAHRWGSVSSPGMSRGLRSVFENTSFFGVACAIAAEGTVIRVGDPLEVHTTQQPLLATP
ncbi:MAG: MOSC N-terminal beta barrel domain-containing protein [Acidimicrobiales bacterium]|nr:MOSC N-terminal beta barrel domain-containing protein [Acidimicrobiales bacterium]